MKKFLFITIGVLSVILGIIGIFVPGLPTTPFILLSSWLFYKSSKRLHDRLHRSPLGKYIRRYESRQGMSLTGKFISIACMWIMISISAFLILEDFKIRVLLLILGAIGTGLLSGKIRDLKRPGRIVQSPPPGHKFIFSFYSDFGIERKREQY